MKGSVFTIIIIIAAVIAVIGMVGFIFLKDSDGLQTPVPTPNASTAAQLAIPVKDYAPNLPMSQKTTILIQTSDSSDVKYIVPANQVSTYVKSLPPGYHVVSQTP